MPSWIFYQQEKYNLVKDYTMIIHVQIGVNWYSCFWVEVILINFPNQLLCKLCPAVTAILGVFDQQTRGSQEPIIAHLVYDKGNCEDMFARLKEIN